MDSTNLVTIGGAPLRQGPIVVDFANTPAGNGVDSTASRQWATRPDDQRFTSLDALMASVNGRRERSEDHVLDLAGFRAGLTDGRRGLYLEHEAGGPLYQPTNYAFGQLCTQMRAPAGFLGGLPDRLAMECLNHGFGRLDSQEVQVLHTGNELRGVTGPNYGRIWDADLVRAIQDVTDAGGGRWEVPQAFRTAKNTLEVQAVTKEDTTLYKSDRDVFIFLVDQRNPIEVGLLADGSPDLYYRGFYAWNGECGGVSNGVGTFLYRYVCMNRMIWGQRGFQKMTIRHTRHAMNKFTSDLVPALTAFVDGSATGIEDGLKLARATRVARDDDARFKFLEMFGIGFREAAPILKLVIDEEGHPAETAWDMMQGVTAHARSIGNTDNRIALERVSETIMDKVLAAA